MRARSVAGLRRRAIVIGRPVPDERTDDAPAVHGGRARRHGRGWTLRPGRSDRTHRRGHHRDAPGQCASFVVRHTLLQGCPHRVRMDDLGERPQPCPARRSRHAETRHRDQSAARPTNDGVPHRKTSSFSPRFPTRRATSTELSNCPATPPRASPRSGSLTSSPRRSSATPTPVRAVMEMSSRRAGGSLSPPPPSRPSPST